MTKALTFADARALALGIIFSLAIALGGCGAIPHQGEPASGYVYGSQTPLRVAVVDKAGAEWGSALRTALSRYEQAAPLIRFQSAISDAHIVITVRDYGDAAPPELASYRFQAGVGGFAAVYDADGIACYFPPSTAPLGCTGEIATVQIYLNDAIPDGDDIEERRLRLVLHELGHALGLTRHGADLSVAQLAQRYGW